MRALIKSARLLVVDVDTIALIDSGIFALNHDGTVDLIDADVIEDD
jgi:hypothetical protein